MKNFFQKNGIMMLAAVTVVAVLLCVASALSSQTGFLQNAGGVIASPFRAVGSAVSGWFSSISQRFEDVEALQQENADLKKENAELQRQLDQAKIDSEENQRLRNLLNLRQQRRDFTFESAVIVDRSTSNWSRVMTLNKGTSSGIAVGNCVVDDQGNLVGVIREAGLNWSTITTILDTDSSLGARVFRTGEVTVAMGDLALMETGRLKLSYLEGESSLINGDLIVTSGGVSAGAFDPLTMLAQAQRGEEAPVHLDFVKVAMQPGKPQGHGWVLADDGRRVPIICLPGNPVSVLVSFTTIVAPALARLAGQDAAGGAEPLPGRPVLTARAAVGWRTPPGRRQHVPVRFSEAPTGSGVRSDLGDGAGLPWVTPTHRLGSGSHLVASLPAAQALAVVAAEVEAVEVGDELPLIPLSAS